MKLAQAGSAAAAPVIRLPMVRFSSKPTQTPQASRGMNPTNQASLYSSVVPVFPPAGARKSILPRAGQPVPWSITERRRSTIPAAVFSSRTSREAGWCS